MRCRSLAELLHQGLPDYHTFLTLNSVELISLMLFLLCQRQSKALIKEKVNANDLCDYVEITITHFCYEQLNMFGVKRTNN